jgi:hypothetical protein
MANLKNLSDPDPELTAAAESLMSRRQTSPARRSWSPDSRSERR